MSFRLDWKGPQVKEQIAERLRAGVDGFNLEVVTQSKQNLYPGHGYRTGALQRAITRTYAHRESQNKIVGTVRVDGIRYGLIVHGKYRYIVEALLALAADAPRRIGGG